MSGSAASELDLKPDLRPARGSDLSVMHPTAVCWGFWQVRLVQVGQNIVVGSEFGKVRALRSASGGSLEEVFPGIPVEVSGLRGMPQAGDDFLVQARWDTFFASHCNAMKTSCSTCLTDYQGRSNMAFCSIHNQITVKLKSYVQRIKEHASIMDTATVPAGKELLSSSVLAAMYQNRHTAQCVHSIKLDGCVTVWQWGAGQEVGHSPCWEEGAERATCNRAHNQGRGGHLKEWGWARGGRRAGEAPAGAHRQSGHTGWLCPVGLSSQQTAKVAVALKGHALLNAQSMLSWLQPPNVCFEARCAHLSSQLLIRAFCIGFTAAEPCTISIPRSMRILNGVLVQGSAEAICASLEGMGSSLVGVKAVPAGLGPVSMADIDMAVGMEGTILSFNVRNSNAAVLSQAKQRGVNILRNNVIYHMIQEVRHLLGFGPRFRPVMTSQWSLRSPMPQSCRHPLSFRRLLLQIPTAVGHLQLLKVCAPVSPTDADRTSVLLQHASCRAEQSPSILCKHACHRLRAIG